jgi:hypothetical protein
MKLRNPVKKSTESGACRPQSTLDQAKDLYEILDDRIVGKKNAGGN